MREIQKEWQKKWREILGEPTENMPDDLDDDFSLICEIWQASDEKIKQCFSLLPKGDIIAERVLEAKPILAEKSNIADDKLLQILDTINSSVSTVLKEYNKDSLAIELNNAKKKCRALKVYRGDEEIRSNVFESSDNLTIHLSDILGDLVKDKLGELGLAAYYFLTEPLCMFFGEDYETSNWILWALIEDSYSVNPYAGVYELYNLRAKAGWNENEMFIYIEE